jgi:hypothetical protein
MVPLEFGARRTLGESWGPPHASIWLLMRINRREQSPIDVWSSPFYRNDQSRHRRLPGSLVSRHCGQARERKSELRSPRSRTGSLIPSDSRWGFRHYRHDDFAKLPPNGIPRCFPTRDC